MSAAAAPCAAPQPPTQPPEERQPVWEGGSDYLTRKLEQKALHRDFDFEVWYPRLANHTWRSTVVDFDSALAEACVHYYHARYNSRRWLFTPADAALLRGLEARLDREIAGLLQAAHAAGNEPPGGFFVRMSNR